MIREASVPRGLVERIAEELRKEIRSGAISARKRLPSVRQLARDRAISAFTAAEVYNALVARGDVEARPGYGYFVPAREELDKTGALHPEYASDSVWERRREASGHAIEIDAGCGWLPSDWLREDVLRAALRSTGRRQGLHVEGYGNPMGLPALRSQLVAQLHGRGIRAREDQIVLTQGASQALDLVVRECLSAGDTVVVEDPGYPPLFELLKNRGMRILTIPRTASGPDTEALRRILSRRPVRCVFTNTTLHNPTGTTTDLTTAQRLLELAAERDFLIVEDDIFAELAMRSPVNLASLDGFRRVLYVCSFSKTISPTLRCGYVAAPPALAQRLARAKVMSALGSSTLIEEIVLQIISHGHYRRHVRALVQRLSEAHMQAQRALESWGLDLAFRPDSGLFLWAMIPGRESVGRLWSRALEYGVLLAPGELFSPEGRASRYWRFNVAHCQHAALHRFLDSVR